MPYEDKGEKVREHIKGAPQDVNDTYNAIMRDKFKGDDSEENQSSAAAIAWSQHNKKKSSPWIPAEHENAMGEMERQPGTPCQCGLCKGQGPPLMPGDPDRHDMGAGDRATMALIPPYDDQSVNMSYQASSDDAEPDKKCPKCEALLQPNVGYDACPHCGHDIKTAAYPYPDEPSPARPEVRGTPVDYLDSTQPTGTSHEWQCSNCGAWQTEAQQAQGGAAWHDCQQCGFQEDPQQQEFQTRQRVARDPQGYGDTPYRTKQWECPECGTWNYEYAGARGGQDWHDCESCDYRETSPTDYNRRQAPEGWNERDQGVYDYDEWEPVPKPGEQPKPSYKLDPRYPDLPHTGKWQVVALGEAQQPGGVGATQTTGLVDGTGVADSEHPDDFTDVGRNSTEENMALQTWVNFTVDMLNRGRSPEEITAQLAHDGCPDPKGVLEKAMAQPEKAPIPNEGAQDPFDAPHNQDETGEMESVSKQPPVVTGAVFSEWEKPWDTKDSDDEKDEDDKDDVKDDKKKTKTADADGQVFDFGGEEKTKGELFDTDAEKTEGGNVFDVDQAEGNEKGELFNIQAPGSETDSPLGDAPSLEKPGTLSKVRIAGTTMTGIEVDRWEDMWGQGLVKVALDDGGTVNVAPEAIQNFEQDQKHPVTEIQSFIDSLPEVEPTRPSIMARVANLELVRRAVRANISRVGFGDQMKLRRFDSDAQDEIIYLKDNFDIVSNANDYAWLQEQPRFQIDAYNQGEAVAVKDAAFDAKLNEEAALWLSDKPGELRTDAQGLAYAAAQYAQANNGNIREFVAAVQKVAYDEDLTGQVGEDGYPIECLDGPEGCQGKLQYRMSLSPSGRPFPRCDAHWNQRLDMQEEHNRKYPVNQPSDFDPDYAGERWDDDY